MRKNTKYMVTTAAMAAMMLGCASVSYAAPTTANKTGWEEVTVDRETKWTYYKDGKMVKSDWVCSPASGLWYYMDSDGYMISNCWGDDRNSDGYWFDENGVMATGWRIIALESDKDSSYGPGSSAKNDEKGYFYFNSSGMVQEGWLNLGGTYYYLNDGYADGFEDYQMVYGSVEIDGEEYYFGESTDGSMKKGMVKIVETKDANTPGATTTESYNLYADDGTRIKDGWGRYNGEWYYLDEDGNVVTECFLYLDKYNDIVSEQNAEQVYYMDKKGTMVTGWLESGEQEEISPGKVKEKSYYYFKTNGAMQTGWLKEGSTYYYLNTEPSADYKKGEMLTGLQLIGDAYYYFGKDGKMAAASWATVEDASGQEHSIYLDSKGEMVKAESPSNLAYATIKSKLYFFDGNGYCFEKGTIIVEGSKNCWTKGNVESLQKGDVYYEIGSGGIAKKYTKK